MITDLKPYAEFKESGLPWLGQVPRHWGRPGDCRRGTFAALAERRLRADVGSCFQMTSNQRMAVCSRWS